MKLLPLLIFTLFAFQSGFSQQVTFYIIGDNVNVREDTTFTKPVHHQLAWGSKFQGTAVSENWYSYSFHGDNYYISSEYATEANGFFELAKDKKERNGYTKFELLLLYKKNNQSDDAESLMFEIINENSRELAFTTYESCRFLGVSSFIALMADEDGFVDYNDNDKLNLVERVIEKSQDSIITAMALVDKAKFQMRRGEIAEAQETMLFILDHYSDKLFLPIPCDYDMESKTYPMKKFINLFVAMVYLSDTPDQRDICLKVKRQRESSDDRRTNEMLSEIYKKLKTDFWLPY